MSRETNRIFVIVCMAVLGLIWLLIITSPSPACAQVEVVTTPVVRPLPEFVQELSPEEYATWAAWQNRQAERRVAARYSYEEPYVYVERIRTKTDSSTRVSLLQRLRQSGRVAATTPVEGRVNTESAGTIEATPFRYVNPSYTPPRAVTVRNPFVKPRPVKGVPDWGNLFVPCSEGTMTLTEAMDYLQSTEPAESVYRTLMKNWKTQ